jgi:hypothetical protein
MPNDDIPADEASGPAACSRRPVLIRIPAWLAGLADWSEDVIRAPQSAINPPGRDHQPRRMRTGAQQT